MITINPNTILEVSMLLCFGIAWPVANLEILRKRRAERAGILPVAMILCGYLAGMGAKLVMGHQTGLPAVFWLYLLNACSVATNLALRWIFSRPPAASCGSVAGAPKLSHL